MGDGRIRGASHRPERDVAVGAHEDAALGVRRVSIGGALARAAWGGFMRAAQGLAEGHFEGFKDAASGAVLNPFFAGALKKG